MKECFEKTILIEYYLPEPEWKSYQTTGIHDEEFSIHTYAVEMTMASEYVNDGRTWTGGFEQEIRIVDYTLPDFVVGQ